ncbi:DUF1702 family protein [Rhizobium sp. 2YAF20]|uniref:DUF1702 family protein n=1 Tax=Rhizobium sp. 2YAF20 TaxID=3233027 RepID=UPI003F9A3DD7
MTRSDQNQISPNPIVGEQLENTISGRLAKNLAGYLNRKVAGIDATQASFTVRRFTSSNAQVQQRLENIGRLFLKGYNTALQTSNISELMEMISDFERRFRGFVIEGAAMGCAIADSMPWAILSGSSNRSGEFLANCSEYNPYLSTVGIGWALARIPWRRRASLRQLDPFLRSLAFDGWGFHDVYFFPRRALEQGKKNSIVNLGGLHGLCAWHQGAGRALWFTSGGDFNVAADLINTLPQQHRGDLFAGLGLAMTYAAGASPPRFRDVITKGGDYLGNIMQGAAFALEAHDRAGTLHPENEDMANALTCQEPIDIVAMVRARMPPAPATGFTVEDGQRSFERWRNTVSAELIFRHTEGRK